MPALAAGVDRAFGFGTRELALMCASHSGEPRHAELASHMLSTIGCTEHDLQCGTHLPYFYQYLEQTPPAGLRYSTLQHNCSGKHSGMLAYCRHCGHDIATYLDRDHPLQKAIRRSVAHFGGATEDTLVAGTDGCSAPNYALPLTGLARAFARLTSAREDDEYGDAPQRLFAAMSAHPELVSGEKRSDLVLMQTGGGDWATKVGAEGVQGIAVRSRGIGIAIKIADGNARALYPVTVAVLQQLGLLADPASTPAAVYFEPPQRNLRGIVTGKIQPVVELRAG